MKKLNLLVSGALSLALTVGLVPAPAFAQASGGAPASSALSAAAAAPGALSGGGAACMGEGAGPAASGAGRDGEGLAPASALSPQSKDGFVVVLDPGHGGHDGGASGNGVAEKTANLAIARYCKAALEKHPGVTVYMTRSDDTYVTLGGRVRFAVKHKADVFVSLHNNAGGGSGSEVIVPRRGSWYYEETYVAGRGLGKAILSRLNALGLGTSGGVYSRDSTNGGTYPDGTLADYYAMIDGTRAAGILGIIVEHAFVDNARDSAFLRSEASLKAIGEADAEAILDYYNSSDALANLYWGVYDQGYYLAHYAKVEEKYDGEKVASLGYFKRKGMKKGQRGSVLFDVEYYRDKYPDLERKYGNKLAKYYRHFLTEGMKEGRRGSAEFSPSYYKKSNPDLRRLYGSDWTAYYRHYADCGMKEGRYGSKAAAKLKLKGATTVYKGVNYADVFDPVYYAKKNADARAWAKKGSKVSGKKLVKHFVKHGMKDGLVAKPAFDVKAYRERYADLQEKYGDDLEAYYLHYLKKGKAEGRDGASS